MNVEICGGCLEMLLFVFFSQLIWQWSSQEQLQPAPNNAAMKPLLSQQGQGDATRQQSLAEGVLGDGRPEPVAALCQGLEGAGRGMHAIVAGVLRKRDKRHRRRNLLLNIWSATFPLQSASDH